MQNIEVSILIAARNEAHNILDLLNSIEELSYPKHKLQVLIGNDNSTDGTELLIRGFIRERAYYQVVNIQENINLKGKTNVLAQLAHLAKGKFLFITDADIELPKDWIQTMLQYFKSNVGVVTGVTVVSSTNWFEGCQAIEWLSALKLMKTLADWGIPATAMGNNMAVTAEAYWAVGGYEKVGFSIVEDYAIFKAIIDKGFGFKQVFEPQITAITKPPQNYFEQRKRWVSGGMKSRSNLIIPLLLQAFHLPIVLITSIFSWKFSFLLFCFGYLSAILLAYLAIKQINQSKLIKYLPIYPIYMSTSWFLQFVYYFLPTKLIWKGRQY